MVMFWVDLAIDGKPQRVCIQFVKRDKTIYARKCAVTFWNPTPAQREVRNLLGKKAVESYGDPLRVLDARVAEAFRGWVRQPQKRSILRDALIREYPRDTVAVETYLENPEV